MARSAHKRMTSHKHCKICQSGRMCKDLESELSRLNSNLQSKSARCFVGIENLSAVVENEDKEAQIAALAEKLKRYALPEIYIDVMIRICIHNWSLAETAEDLHIVSREQVRRIYNKGLELLKERKFK